MTRAINRYVVVAFAVVAGCSAIAPRFTTIGLVITLLVLASACTTSPRAFREQVGQRLQSAVTIAALVVIGWALLSVIWSADVSDALLKAVTFAALVLLATVAAIQIERCDAVIEDACLGLVIGFLLAALLIGVETATGQALTKLFYNTFPSWQAENSKQLAIQNGVVYIVGDAALNRRIAVSVFLFWPAVLALTLCRNDLLRRVGLALSVLLLAVILRWSHSQSGQLALVLSTIVWLIALRAPLIAGWLAAAGWSAGVLLAIPLALLLQQMHVEDSKWLFESARARIPIWSQTAHAVIEHPLLGRGPESMRHIYDAQSKPQASAKPVSGVAGAKYLAKHPHNVYLQIWHDLGAVGALSILVLGLLLLRSIVRLAAGVRPYLLAAFTSNAVFIVSSYGLWQSWLQSAVILGLVMGLCGAGLHRHRQRHTNQDENVAHG